MLVFFFHIRILHVMKNMWCLNISLRHFHIETGEFTYASFTNMDAYSAWIKSILEFSSTYVIL